MFWNKVLSVMTAEGQLREELSNMPAFERYADRQGIRAVDISARYLGRAPLDTQARVIFQNGDTLDIRFKDFGACRRYFHRLHGRYGYRITLRERRPPRPSARLGPSRAVTLAALALLVLWLAIFRPLHADTLRIDAEGVRSKYEGTMIAVYDGIKATPPWLVFQQTAGLPIGGGPVAPPFILGQVWSVYFTKPDGTTVLLDCHGQFPEYYPPDGFHGRFACDVQP